MKGKTYIVTGGGSGSGRAVAKRLMASGANVIIWGRSQQKLTEAVEAGDATFSVLVDVSKPIDVARGFDVAAEYDELVGFVHCAGIWTSGALDAVSETTVVGHINNVVVGTTLCVRGAVRAMARSGGRIVQVAAASGKPGFSETALNMLAKRAQDGLQEGLATELKGTGIEFTTVYPDNIGAASSDKVNLGKAMSYDDVAEAVMWALNVSDTVWVQEILLTSPNNPRLG